MKKKAAALVLFSFAMLYAVAAFAQHEHHHEAAAPASIPVAGAQDEMNQATDVMARHSHEDHEHHMGPHMKMSELRTAQPGDSQKADAVVLAARAVMENYKDPAAAEADGYKLFLPQIKHQKQYHYTN